MRSIIIIFHQPVTLPKKPTKSYQKWERDEKWDGKRRCEMVGEIWDMKWDEIWDHDNNQSIILLPKESEAIAIWEQISGIRVMRGLENEMVDDMRW